jgi:hypothetical protein
MVPKGFKRVRYYGVQATKSFAKLKPLIQAALAKVQHVIKGAIKIIAPMTYRQRYHQSTGRDPLRYPHCQGEMALSPLSGGDGAVAHLASHLWGHL